MTAKYRLKRVEAGWPAETIVTKCDKDPSPLCTMTLVESSTPGYFRHGSNGYNSQPAGMFGAWVTTDNLEEVVTPSTLTVLDLNVGEEYRIHPDLVQEKGYYPGVYTKGDGFSTRNNGTFTVQWEGHQNLEVVRVVKDQTPEVGEQKPQVLPASSVPPVTVKRKVLTINNIGVGQTFIVHGKPDEVYVKISNSHVFNHKLLQMHATDAQRFQSHLNLVVVELVVYNGK